MCSPLDMKILLGDADHIAPNLLEYLEGFSPSVRDLFECFDFHHVTATPGDLARCKTSHAG
jgi:hypothetical protein